MRAPFQVLVIPFRFKTERWEFAVLKRSDADYWQFIAGGGEDAETPLQAARRETEEEIGVVGEVVALDSLSTVRKDCFADAAIWGDDVFVILEYAFAVNIGPHGLCLSGEHTEFRWLPFDEASRLLKWDSNRTALWELNERLKASNQDKPLCLRSHSSEPKWSTE